MSARDATSTPVDKGYVLLGPEGTRPFDAVSLESELRAMWKLAGSEGPGKGGTVYRAALANLVVPVDPRQHAQIAPVLVEVTRRHPSRLFLIEPGALPRNSGLRARTAALCHLREGGGGLVCSEQVILQTDPVSVALLPSAVRSLLVGDLPMVLLDFHVESGLPWMDELVEMADLVLEDSWLWERPEEESAVWRLLERQGAVKVHDLAWARLTPWREILAEAFDATENTAALRTIRDVTVEFAGSDFPPSPAWLLVGWLASRLGWSPDGGGRDALRLRSDSGPVRVTLRADPSREGRTLQRIRLRSTEPHPLDLEIVHHGRDATATIAAWAPRPLQREVAFGYREFAACIVGEIHRHEPNRSLETAAQIAQELIRQWNGG